MMMKFVVLLLTGILLMTTGSKAAGVYFFD